MLPSDASRPLRRAFVLLAATALAAGLARSPAWAGPPLALEDPEILDPGTFEVIFAGFVETRPSGDTYELPILDVSYGISPNVQVSVVAPRIVIDPDGESSRSDLGLGQFSLKWRFFNRDGWQLSVAPQLATPLRRGAVDRGLVEPGDLRVLPVEFQYEFPSFRVLGEVGYVSVEAEGDEWVYGLAAAWPLNERVELLAEVHGGALVAFDERSVLYRLGADIALGNRWHLLAAAGSSFSESGNDDTRLQAYLGLQWFP